MLSPPSSTADSVRAAEAELRDIQHLRALVDGNTSSHSRVDRLGSSVTSMASIATASETPSTPLVAYKKLSSMTSTSTTTKASALMASSLPDSTISQPPRKPTTGAPAVATTDMMSKTTSNVSSRSGSVAVPQREASFISRLQQQQSQLSREKTNLETELMLERSKMSSAEDDIRRLKGSLSAVTADMEKAKAEAHAAHQERAEEARLRVSVTEEAQKAQTLLQEAEKTHHHLVQRLEASAGEVRQLEAKLREQPDEQAINNRIAAATLPLVHENVAIQASKDSTVLVLSESLRRLGTMVHEAQQRDALVGGFCDDLAQSFTMCLSSVESQKEEALQAYKTLHEHVAEAHRVRAVVNASPKKASQLSEAPPISEERQQASLHMTEKRVQTPSNQQQPVSATSFPMPQPREVPEPARGKNSSELMGLLQRTLDDLETERRSSDELRRTLQSLHTSSSPRTGVGVAALEGELASTRQLLAQQRDANVALRSSEAKLEQRISELSAECEQLNEESEMLHASLRKANIDLRVVKVQRTTEVEELSNSTIDARAQLKGKDSDIVALQARVKMLESVEKRQLEDLEAAGATIDSLTTEVKLFREASSNETRVATGELESLRAELDIQRNLVAKLELRAMEAEQQRIAPAVHQAECDALRRKVTDAEQHAALLQQRVDDDAQRLSQHFNLTVDHQRSADGLCVQLQQQLDHVSAENLTLATTVDALQKQLHDAAVRSVGGASSMKREAEQSELAEAAAAQLLRAAEEMETLQEENATLRLELAQAEKRAKDTAYNSAVSRSLSRPRQF